MVDTCAVIPVFEHGQTVASVVAAAQGFGLRVILVDDGSGADCARILDAIAQRDPDVRLFRHPVNHGKGAAVQTGLRAAAALGFAHALQVDADGQHALDDIPRLLAESKSLPEAVVCGLPIFAEDAPRSRLMGRRLTNFWVSVHTWSTAIPDAMCGFRVYPLETTVPLLDRVQFGNRMDFDIQVVVQLHWLGIPFRWVPTRVSYPPGGASHFRLRLDNALITRAHAGLFLGMLMRTPSLAARKVRLARSRYSVA